MIKLLPLRYLFQPSGLIAIIVISYYYLTFTHSVIMPPKLYYSSAKTDSDREIRDDSDVPYTISINEGDSIDVGINSSSNITVNLNRAVFQDISILVQIFSGHNLIKFIDSDNSSTKQNYTFTYAANTFGDRVISFKTEPVAGHANLVCKILNQPSTIHIDDSSSYVSVNIYKSSAVNLIISIVGWIYFFAWSLSFYFQVILNYQRKSVVGLNFDFLALNILGFTCYLIYNCVLKFSVIAQREYYERNEYSRIPVEYNDVFFALHAVILTLITIIQCFIYERGQQSEATLGKVLSYVFRSFIIASLIIAMILCFTNLFYMVSLLDIIIYLSYVKLIVTLIKYIPQAYLNYSRKTTVGWSIHNILLDFVGGLFSLAQLFFIAYNFDDWTSVFGNFTKFGLGVISISFDVLFVVQHYVLYREVGLLDVSTESIPSPVISESVISNYQPSERTENEVTAGESNK